MIQMKTKLLSITLALCMVLSMLVAPNVFATGEPEGDLTECLNISYWYDDAEDSAQTLDFEWLTSGFTKQALALQNDAQYLNLRINKMVISKSIYDFETNQITKTFTEVTPERMKDVSVAFQNARGVFAVEHEGDTVKIPMSLLDQKRGEYDNLWLEYDGAVAIMDIGIKETGEDADYSSFAGLYQDVDGNQIKLFADGTATVDGTQATSTPTDIEYLVKADGTYSVNQLTLHTYSANLSFAFDPNGVLTFTKTGGSNQTAPSYMTEGKTFTRVYSAPIAFVGGTGYYSIQEALDAAPSGGTVTLAAGAFNESLQVKKPVTILGAQKDVAATDASRGEGESVLVGSIDLIGNQSLGNTTINGLTVKEGRLTSWYQGLSDTSVTVKNCIFQDASVNPAAIDNNKGSANWTFADNLFTFAVQNDKVTALTVSGGADVTITGNTIKNAGRGINVGPATGTTVIKNNLVEDTALRAFQFSGSYTGTIEMTGNTIRNAGTGLRFHNSFAYASETAMNLTKNFFIGCDEDLWNITGVDTDGTVTGTALDASKNYFDGTPVINKNSEEDEGHLNFTVTATPYYVDEEMTKLSTDVSAISISATEGMLEAGKTFTLTATVTGEAEASTEVEWSTSDPAVATVEGGVVTGVAKGNVVITAKSKQDASKTASCQINVSEVSKEGDSTVVDTAPDVTQGEDGITVTIPATDTIKNATAENPVEVKTEVPADTANEVIDQATDSANVEIALPKEVTENEAVSVSGITVDQSIFDKAKEKKVEVNFVVKDQESGKPLYTWTFDGEKATTTKSVNLAIVAVDSTKRPEIDSTIPRKEKAVVVDFMHEGTFPTPTATVRLNVTLYGFKAGDKLHLYYYNETTKKLEIPQGLTDNELTVGGDGFVSMAIPHCSSYVLAAQAEEQNPVDPSTPSVNPSTPSVNPSTPSVNPSAPSTTPSTPSIPSQDSTVSTPSTDHSTGSTVLGNSEPSDEVDSTETPEEDVPSKPGADKTGDTFPYTALVIFLIAAAGAALTVVLYRTKQRANK